MHLDPCRYGCNTLVGQPVAANQRCMEDANYIIGTTIRQIVEVSNRLAKRSSYSRQRELSLEHSVPKATKIPRGLPSRASEAAVDNDAARDRSNYDGKYTFVRPGPRMASQ
jgi:hypothetical protein